MLGTLPKILTLAAAFVVLAVAPAAAQHHGGGGHGGGPGWHGHSHVSFAFGYGGPWRGWPGYGYSAPPTYYYPPYYPPYSGYTYPPYAYAAPPAYGASPGTVAPTMPARECRDYNGDATIDANGTPFYGQACLEADGRWHIVQ
jgi:hypothetical protein